MEDTLPRPARGRGSILHPNLMVNHLYNFGTNEWHLPILQEFLDPGVIRIIQGLEISPTFMEENFIWHFTKSGKYTVKSGYWLAKEIEKNQDTNLAQHYKKCGY